MISVRDLSVDLGGTSVLSGVSFTATTSQHIALVGPNGAGKSTLLRALAGVQLLRNGTIEIGGYSLGALSLTERAKTLSYLPQSRDLAWDLSVEDVVALGRFAWGGERYARLPQHERALLDAAMSQTGVDAYLGRAVHTLSGGEQARVHLARVLAGGGDLLLLDEPCAALDIRHQLSFMRLLEDVRQSGKTIITVLHDLSLAERFASRIIVLDQGKLVADAAAQNALTTDVLSSIFGIRRRGEHMFDTL